MRGSRSYFWTLVSRSLLERKARVIVSMLTVALGTSVVGGFVILYSDIEAKMSRELRAYGANFVVKSEAAGASLRDDALDAVREVIPADRLIGVQRLVYEVGKVKDNRVVVVGIDFDSIHATTPFWQLAAGAIPADADAGACLLGKDIARRLRVDVGTELAVEHEGRAQRSTVAAIIETGGAEDEQVFLPIEVARALFARPGEIDLLAASIVAEVAQADLFARGVEQRVRGCRAVPIRKLARSEGEVLATIGSVVSVVVAFIVLSTFVCLLISLMATVSERRKEAALMKALGATDRTVGTYFLAEVTATGVVGGLNGLLAGYGLAQLMARTIFGTAVAFHGWLAAPVLACSLLITLAGAVIPLRRVAGIPPAIVLKGE